MTRSVECPSCPARCGWGLRRSTINPKVVFEPMGGGTACFLRRVLSFKSGMTPRWRCPACIVMKTQRGFSSKGKFWCCGHCNALIGWRTKGGICLLLVSGNWAFESKIQSSVFVTRFEVKRRIWLLEIWFLTVNSGESPPSTILLSKDRSGSCKEDTGSKKDIDQ